MSASALQTVRVRAVQLLTGHVCFVKRLLLLVITTHNCRRVEITGPVDRKMVINGLNSGASTYMADFEDSTAPTWANVLEGQANLHDACLGTIEYR